MFARLPHVSDGRQFEVLPLAVRLALQLLIELLLCLCVLPIGCLCALQPRVTVVEFEFVRIRNPHSRDAVEKKYRHARISVTSDSHVRYKLYDTEEEWNRAAEAQGGSHLSVDDVEKDQPLAIRYCTMVSKDKSRSVLVQAPNAGYTSVDNGFIDPLLVIRKIKFESHDKAVSWSNTLNQHSGDDHGHHHVDTTLLENKIIMHAISSFASQEMGATKAIPPASPSKAVMSNLVLSHVYKLSIIPGIQQMTIPIINKPMPNFVKQRSFKGAVRHGGGDGGSADDQSIPSGGAGP